MTTTTTTPVEDLVAQLQRKLESLGNGRDCLSENEKAIWFANRREIASIITGLRNDDLDKPMRLLAQAEAERDAHLAARAEIEAELAVVVTQFADSRARDDEHDRRLRAERRLQLLDRGELLCAPGMTYTALPILDARIAELKEKIDRLRRRHAAFIDQAHAVLGLRGTSQAHGERASAADQ